MSTTISPRIANALAQPAANDNYKWIALINMTLGTLMATIDGSITLIAMPDIFRGIHLDPLLPSNSFYLLWMLLGFLVVTSVLVVNFGRLGDIYGRVRLYNLGFVIYTISSLFLAIVWLNGREAATYLIVFRIVQGIGSALILANAGAIITDAFPAGQRGTALGINNIAGLSGTFIGLVLGGILAPIDWRLVFLISVPPGVVGTAWAYWKLEERSTPRPGKIDWLGNATFAVGLVSFMIGITYGIEPYGNSTMGWTSPKVLGFLIGGIGLLSLFVWIEHRVESPMFSLSLFRIRAFTFGSTSTLLSGIARGGLMFMLIIWLQGIWLPEHGYSFEKTPLWAGIYMIPLTAGFLVSGPISGLLSDRYGQRQFATGGMIASSICFLSFLLLPVNFSYGIFAVLLFLLGVSNGMFFAPNRAAVLNSLPPRHRGSGNGMNSTFQNSAQVLSIGIFFTLMIVGLSASLPASLTHGLLAQGVPAKTASTIAHLPPISVLFAAFLGYNPMQHLLGTHVLSQLSAAHRSLVTGREFFPSLISAPFHSGLHEAFTFSAIVCFIAALLSWSRGVPTVAPAEESVNDDEDLAPSGAEFAHVPD